MMNATLDEAIGARYRVHPLKTLRERRSRLWRTLQLEASFLTPEVFLLRTEDGRAYKLLTAGRTNRHWIDLLLYNYGVAADLEFVPRLIWHDDRHILTEFIEGETPDVYGRDFAVALGQCMARLHQVDVGTRSFHSILKSVENDLAAILETGLMIDQVAERLRDHLSAHLPAAVRTSLVYVDLQPANFCIAPDGHLILFDVGSFQRGRITDDGFFGHKLARPSLARMLEFAAFKESYLEAGGLSYLFDWVDLFEALDDIRKAALCARRYHGLPSAPPGSGASPRIERPRYEV
jgi:hypothetical protein